MATYKVEVDKDSFASSERCSADPQKLKTVGRALGHQVRIKRVSSEQALYTVSKANPTGDKNNLVRMGEAGLKRLGMDKRFEGELDSQVPHLTYNDDKAEQNNEFVERINDNGTSTELIAIAPHGGEIEPWTDRQAEHIASLLAGMGVSSWLCKGYGAKEGDALRRWHITSSDIHQASFPTLNSIISRGFKRAVALHGFHQPEILIGGAAPQTLKEEIATAIALMIAGALDKPVPVRIAKLGEKYNGDDPKNIVNRLAPNTQNGIQIEQSLDIRRVRWREIADVVAYVYASKLAVTRGRLAIHPTSIDFGQVPVGDTSERTLTITNRGPANVTLSFPPFGRPYHTGPFHPGDVVDQVITPGDKITASVFFLPGAIESAQGKLVFYSTADGSPHSVNLSGRGVKGEPR